jgi:hypothetical protein
VVGTTLRTSARNLLFDGSASSSRFTTSFTAV